MDWMADRWRHNSSDPSSSNFPSFLWFFDRSSIFLLTIDLSTQISWQIAVCRPDIFHHWRWKKCSINFIMANVPVSFFPNSIAWPAIELFESGEQGIKNCQNYSIDMHGNRQNIPFVNKWEPSAQYRFAFDTECWATQYNSNIINNKCMYT